MIDYRSKETADTRKHCDVESLYEHTLNYNSYTSESEFKNTKNKGKESSRTKSSKSGTIKC